MKQMVFISDKNVKDHRNSTQFCIADPQVLKR